MDEIEREVEKMVKKIFVDGEDIMEENEGRRNRHSQSRGVFEEKFTKYQGEHNRPHRRQGPQITETKLFTDRNKLVEYANEKGKSNAIIDIYKIEDGLYKLVIKK